MRNIFKKLITNAILVIALLILSACGDTTPEVLESVFEGEFINENGADGGIFSFTGNHFTFTFLAKEIDPSFEESSISFMVRGTFAVDYYRNVIDLTIDEDALLADVASLVRDIIMAGQQFEEDFVFAEMINFFFGEVLGGTATQEDAEIFAENLLFDIFMEITYDDIDDESVLRLQNLASERAQDLAFGLFHEVGRMVSALQAIMMAELAGMRLGFEDSFDVLYDAENYFLRR